MPEITKLVNAASNAVNNSPETHIDPITGLEMTKPRRGKSVPVPTDEDRFIAGAVHQYKSSTPDTDYNYRPLIGDRSKYDVDIKPTELDALVEGNPEDFGTSLEDIRSQNQGS